MCCPGGLSFGEGCLSSVLDLGTYVQHEAQLSVEAGREAGRKTLCSIAKGDRRASGSREPFRCLPGVSEYTWAQGMILLNVAPATPHPILISPSQLLSYLTHVTQRYLELLDPDRLFLGSCPSHILSRQRLPVLSPSPAPARPKHPYSGFPENPGQTSLMTFHT